MENSVSKMVNDVPKVNYHELDDLLIDKIVESGAMRFTTDAKLNRMALKCVLLANNNSYPNIYLPPDIQNTIYKYIANGILQMSYEYETGKYLNLEVTFDETQIKEIKEIKKEKGEISR